MGLDGLDFRMGSDLSLDLRYFATKAVKQARDVPASDVDACIRRLEEERGKIEKFMWELQLCTCLLAKEAGKMMKSDRKAAEEDVIAEDKSKWMSTTQLWIGDSSREDAESKRQDKGRSLPEVTSCGGDAFLPFKAMGSGVPAFAPLCFRVDDKAADAGMTDLSLLSLPTIKNASIATGTTIESRRQVMGFAHVAPRAVTIAPSTPRSLSLRSQQQQTPQQQQQHARKTKCTWSLELHRQFVTALNRLGGPQVATPKLIRKLMKVDGLTNDERYRLHNRRAPGSAIVSQPIESVGGLWIPGEQTSSHSGSPRCPFHFSASGLAVSSASIVSWVEEDGRSDSYDWK